MSNVDITSIFFVRFSYFLFIFLSHLFLAQLFWKWCWRFGNHDTTKIEVSGTAHMSTNFNVWSGEKWWTMNSRRNIHKLGAEYVCVSLNRILLTMCSRCKLRMRFHRMDSPIVQSAFPLRSFHFQISTATIDGRIQLFFFLFSRFNGRALETVCDFDNKLIFYSWNRSSFNILKNDILMVTLPKAPIDGEFTIHTTHICLVLVYIQINRKHKLLFICKKLVPVWSMSFFKYSKGSVRACTRFNSRHKLVLISKWRPSNWNYSCVNDI